MIVAAIVWCELFFSTQWWKNVYLVPPFTRGSENNLAVQKPTRICVAKLGIETETFAQFL